MGFSMKKCRLGLLGLTLTSVVAIASANAADMYRAAPAGSYKDGPVYAPVATWTGFYVGVNGGYGWTPNASVLGADFSPSGGFGGGQIGYNWQGAFGLGSHLVLGVEADIQGSGISDNVGFGFASEENTLNWFGTVRGRIGYAMDRTLIYFTGGFAFGEVESKGHFLRTPFDVTETQTGYVLGGGLEYKINPAWSIKGEYQFLSLDASDLNGAGPLNDGGTDRSEVHTVRVGLNYHVGQGYEPLK
jgi:outer membrane immunogenic protein